MDFKLTKLTGNNVVINDNNGIVNGASSFVKKMSFSINGREVYQCNSANHVGKSNTQEIMKTMVGRQEFLLKLKILLLMRGLLQEKIN